MRIRLNRNSLPGILSEEQLRLDDTILCGRHQRRVRQANPCERGMGNSGSSDGGSGGAWDVQGLASDLSTAKQMVKDGKDIQQTLSGKSTENSSTHHDLTTSNDGKIANGMPVQQVTSSVPLPEPVLPVTLPGERSRLARTRSTLPVQPKPTAIVKAAAAGDEALLTSLLDMKMNIHQQDKFGFTALHAACAFGHRAIAKTLISNGALIDLQAVDGSTPLYCALSAPTIFMEVVNALLAANADVNIATAEGETPLFLAVKNNCLDLVNKLIGKGATVDLNHAITLSTPLHVATIFANLEIIKLLHEKGAQINKQDVYGKTPLILAVENKKGEEIVKFLMSVGADIKYADMSGKTAVHHAVLQGSLPIVGILLEDQDAANVQDVHGRTPLHYAANYPIDPEIFHLLIKKKSLINAVDDKGRTPLHLAAKYNNMREVRVLLASGADANREDMQGNTPCGLAGGKKSPIYQLLEVQGGSISDEERMRAYKRDVTIKRLKSGVKVGSKVAKCCIGMPCC